MKELHFVQTEQWAIVPIAPKTIQAIVLMCRNLVKVTFSSGIDVAQGDMNFAMTEEFPLRYLREIEVDKVKIREEQLHLSYLVQSILSTQTKLMSFTLETEHSFDIPNYLIALVESNQY